MTCSLTTRPARSDLGLHFPQESVLGTLPLSGKGLVVVPGGPGARSGLFKMSTFCPSLDTAPLHSSYLCLRLKKKKVSRVFSLHTVYVPHAGRGQKRSLDILKLVLQTSVSHLWVLGTEPWESTRLAASALNC